jgi:hypothetical protein
MTGKDLKRNGHGIFEVRNVIEGLKKTAVLGDIGTELTRI